MRGATHRVPGLVLTEHLFEVPLRHPSVWGEAEPGTPAAALADETIEVFAREVVAPAREGEDLPWLVFLQGGPGFGSPRPHERSGWLDRALRDHKVLLLDQRGTGRSSPVSHQTLAGLDAATQAEHLACYRADSIVADAEAIRRELLGDRRWTVRGQSFGGFCALTYLSASPHGLERVLVTGGLPSLDRPAADVYRHTWPRVRDRNARYYARYPDDVDRVRRLVDHLGEHEVRLPDGDRLTPRRLQQLGLEFGMSDGFERVHYLLEEAFARDGAGGRVPLISEPFLRVLDHLMPYQGHLLFSILHEAAYCQGEASHWAAHRVAAEFPEFDPAGDGPVHFTGEMIFPWMFEEYAALRPLAEAAELLARKDDWPALYDPDALAHNEVPCAAVVYEDDMYVERTWSLETAGRVGSLRVWHTNEYDHNALRADGVRVLGRLLDMVAGEA